MTTENGRPSARPAPPNELEAQLRRLSRRGFAVGGAAALATLGGWRWLQTREREDRLIWPLRRVLEANETLSRAAFRGSRLTPTFPASRASLSRAVGSAGFNPAVNPEAWTLRVVGPTGDRRFSLAEIRMLPRVEMTTEFKCIEGWSEIVSWAGARLVDLAALSGLATRSGRVPDPKARPLDLLEYVALETPDAGYYVGLDMASALHPQTLLCYEMGRRPLTLEHGAPLRLAIPVKYGVKNLKWIGTIRFTDRRPRDYWAEMGYDWYAGL